jgi:hypothetical protein
MNKLFYGHEDKQRYKIPLYSYVIFIRILMFYVSFKTITQKYNVTNYTGNMMIVLLDDKAKQIDIYFQIFIYFIVLF